MRFKETYGRLSSANDVAPATDAGRSHRHLPDASSPDLVARIICLNHQDYSWSAESILTLEFHSSCVVEGRGVVILGSEGTSIQL